MIKSQQKSINKLGEGFSEILHFRVPYALAKNKLAHVAVVVMSDGSGYVGASYCGKNDEYRRKVGYHLAVARALKAAHHEHMLMWLDAGLFGKGLMVEVRKRINESLVNEAMRISKEIDKSQVDADGLRNGHFAHR